MVDAYAALAEGGYSPGASGNLSVRDGARMWITPSGVEPRALSPGGLVSVDFDGRAEGPGAPSSEWRLHAALYRGRPEIGAVVHTHSRYATILACAGRAIPSLHYMVAATGAFEIPLAPYATFGTQALSDRVVETLGSGRACLLANHGQVALGRDLAAAVATAELVEHLAETTWGSLAIGGPVLLDDVRMQEAADRFAAGYGQPGGPGEE